MPTYLIAYDISHPRRLAQVARRLERHGRRIQKSVFLVEREERWLRVFMMDELAPLVRPRVDLIEGWQLATTQPTPRLLVGQSTTHSPAVTLIGAGPPVTLERPELRP